MRIVLPSHKLWMIKHTIVVKEKMKKLAPIKTVLQYLYRTTSTTYSVVYNYLFLQIFENCLKNKIQVNILLFSKHKLFFSNVLYIKLFLIYEVEFLDNWFTTLSEMARRVNTKKLVLKQSFSSRRNLRVELTN